MKHYAYNCYPIDYGWEYLSTVKETLERIIKRTIDSQMDYENLEFQFVEVSQFVESWKNAQELAIMKGWEGDFRHEPSVFWLPGEGEFEYGFVFKQENNGDTFVISPKPLSCNFIDED